MSGPTGSNGPHPRLSGRRVAAYFVAALMGSDMGSGTVVLHGLAGGIAGAIALRGAIASQLYGIGALDPMGMLAAIAVLGVMSLIACWAPRGGSRRSARRSALSRQ